MRPKDFFDSNPKDLEEVVRVVRQGFGRNTDFQDIYNHVTTPENVYLLRNGDIKAMASYSRATLSGFDSLIVEGIVMLPEIQGKGLFKEITKHVADSEAVIGLRTQTPMMYGALLSYCHDVYPNCDKMPAAIKAVRDDFAKHLGCEIDDRGVIRGHYGGLFYGKEPCHKEYDLLFKKYLGMDLNKGDAVLLIGTGLGKSIPRMTSEDHDSAMCLI